MSFFSPWAWFYLLLALPVLIFYLLKQKPRKRVVSNLLFWNQLSTQLHNQPFWRKFRNWISYLLQLIFIFILAFALSRPFFSKSKNVNHKIIILDPSVSMSAIDVNDNSSWIESIKLAGSEIDRLRYIDQAIILTAENTPKIISEWSNNKQNHKQLLKTAQTVDLETEIIPVLKLARNLSRTVDNYEIIFFTDGVWLTEESYNTILNSGLLENVSLVHLKKSIDNIGITNFSARRNSDFGTEYILTASINFTGKSNFNERVLLYRNNQLIDAIDISFKNSNAWNYTWIEKVEQKVQYKLKLESNEQDRLTDDNSATLELAPIKPIKINLVGKQDQFLEAVFLSIPGVTVSKILKSEDLPVEQMSSSSLSVFNKSVPPENFKESFALIINPERDGFWGTYKDEVKSPLISSWKSDATILNFTGLENIKVNSAGNYLPSEISTTFADSFGVPLIWGYEHTNKFNWILLAFDIDATDLPFRTAFPIFMGNIISEIRPFANGVSAELPGQPATLFNSSLPDSLSDSNNIKKNLSWWSAFPIWWLLVILALIWCVIEMGLYSKRITE